MPSSPIPPIIGPGFELGALSFNVLIQQEWPRADRFFGRISTEGLGHDHCRILEQVLWHTDLGGVKVQFDRIVIHFFDARRLEIAHQSEQRRANGLVEPLGKVEDYIVGIEILPVVELDAFAQVECPLGDIRIGFPLFQQQGDGDVIGARESEIFEYVSELVGCLSPGEPGRVIEALHACGDRYCSTSFGARPGLASAQL